MKYIQRRCLSTNKLETVDEFETSKEARTILKEYVSSDTSGRFYISNHPCKAWVQRNGSYEHAKKVLKLEVAS